MKHLRAPFKTWSYGPKALDFVVAAGVLSGALSAFMVVIGVLIGSTAWGQQSLNAAGQDTKPWVLHDQNELSALWSI